MAIKKAYYYTVSISNEATNEIIQNNYKEYFDYAFEEYLNEDGTYEPLILEEGEIIHGQRIDRITMDIIFNDMNYLFVLLEYLNLRIIKII